MQSLCNLQRLLHRVSHFTSGHFNAQLLHGMFEFDTVLAALNGIYLNADDLYIIFVQNTGLGQFGTEIQTGLSAQIR